MDKNKGYKYALGAFGLLAVVGGFLVLNKTAKKQKYGDDGLAIKMEINPDRPQAGEAVKMVFALEDKYGYAPTLYVNHSRRLHAVIVGEDMDVFGHIHPEDFGEVTEDMLYGGKYETEFTFPKAGKYVIALDGKSDEGEFHRKFSVTVGGEIKMVEAKDDARDEKCFRGYPEDGTDRIVSPIFSDGSEVDCAEGYSVKLSSEPKEIKAGVPVRISYHIEKNGEYVKDLEPYLNAGAHFILVSKDMRTAIHSHGGPSDMKMDQSYFRLIPAALAHGFGADDEEAPMEPRIFGPDITSKDVVFPNEGTYYLFGQFKHQGKIVFTKFAINVARGNDQSAEGMKMK